MTAEFPGCVMPEPVPVSELVLPVYGLAISAMRTPLAVVAGNCGLTTVLATVCTMLRAAQRRSFCFVVEIRLPRLQISGRHRCIGLSTKRGGSMSRLTKNYRESLLQALQDPQEAAEYLTAVLEEDDSAAFLFALRDVADARGMSTLAAKAQLNRENLYRMLSEHGNPQLDSLTARLDALDLRLAVAVK
jgi:probable addiction module antidote protein